MHDDTKLVTHRPKRRHHTAQFKAQVVALCQQPHVSMASVARAHDLNANLLRRWVSDHQRQQLRLEPSVGVVSEFGKNRTLSERLATRDAIVKHFVIYGILLKLA